MPKTKRPVIKLGPLTVRALSGNPGAWRWRAEWYPEGGNGKMQTASLSRVRGERFDRDEAISRAAELLAAGRHLDGPATPTAERSVETVRDLLELWLGTQRRRVGVEIRQSSWDSYRVCCARIADMGSFGDLRLTDVGDSELRRLYQRLLARCAGRTVKHTQMVLSIAWRWGAKQGWCSPLPVIRLRTASQPQRMPTVAEVETTLQALAAGTPSPRRTEAIAAVRILLGTGARPGELASTHVEQVNLTAGVWTVLESKNKPRQVPLNDDCRQVFGDLIGDRTAGLLWAGGDYRIYCTWGRHVREACKRAGVESWSLKGLRHLACTRMLASGIDVATAASITGHSPTVLLDSYAHVLEHRRQAAVAALARPEAQVIAFPRPSRG